MRPHEHEGERRRGTRSSGESAGRGWRVGGSRALDVLGLALVVCFFTGCASAPSAHRSSTGNRVARAPRPLVQGSLARPSTPRAAAPGEAWSDAIQSWLGTPYRYGGTDRRGIDCSGFARQIYLEVARVNLPHRAADQYRLGRAVTRATLRRGDLVFFAEPRQGVTHVGISLGQDDFAHASTKRGVIISSLREAYYSSRFCGARRLVD